MKIVGKFMLVKLLKENRMNMHRFTSNDTREVEVIEVGDQVKDYVKGDQLLIAGGNVTVYGDDLLVGPQSVAAILKQTKRELTEEAGE